MKKEKLDSRFLLDSFCKEGTDLDEFKDLIDTLDNHIKHIEQPLHDFDVLSIKPRHMQNDSSVISCWHLHPSNPVNDGKGIPSVSLPSTKENKIYEDLIAETMNTNNILLYDNINKKMFFISNYAINTLAQRLGQKATGIREPSLERDIFLAKRMNQNGNTLFIVKEFKGIRKIFAMMKPSYQPIPLQSFYRIYVNLAGDSRFESMRCDGWKVDHNMIYIALSFPEYAGKIRSIFDFKFDMIPCLEIQSSVIGDGSLKAWQFWKMPNGNKVCRHQALSEHKGNTPVERFEKRLKDDILDKYLEFPERLKQLASLRFEGSSDEKGTMIFSIIRSVFEQIKLADTAGPKRTDALISYIGERVITHNRSYTAYDIVIELLTLKDDELMRRKKYSQETLRKIRETISKAVDADFTCTVPD